MRILHPDANGLVSDPVAEGESAIVVTHNELLALVGAINEALEAVDEWEFETRVGVAPEEAQEVRDQLARLLDDPARLD
ncbi:MAG TPA: hypothetical protein VGK18_04145 [Propionicimonas sp.]|jgi:hypothetical protein|uniref:hypothetical protein n=1 Tax=Propionicimonas sp. TaxID=1955623 RepID=UPI002F422763